jgi:hypothetical protein
MATEAINNPFESKQEIAQKRQIPKERLNRKYACTVVNLLPRELFEDKPHLLPNTFLIPPATFRDGKFEIAVLHVTEAIHYVPNPLIDEGKPGSSFRVVTPPNELARSLVDDYKSGNICLSPEAEPGLFWVEGLLTAEEIKELHEDEIREADRKQRNWFRNLVALADADWEKNHNRLAVSDLQRLAARCLGINKDWVEMEQMETVRCPFCTISIPTSAIKCPNCKEVVSKEGYRKLTEQLSKG